jgi:SAM-dependent methyltransferase
MSMNALLTALRAAAEPTRLRLLALCARTELTVTELTQVLGQSQPRVSRHLKLMCEAGLLNRFREGTWAFYRLSDQGEEGKLARALVALVPADDAGLARDFERLESVKANRAAAAAAYFRANAARWREIRSLYVPEADVEAALLRCLGGEPIGDFLDVGTGTGRILELLGHQIERGIGVDLSHEMLGIARANLERDGLRHCQVRHADMYRLPLSESSIDAITFHQVLHFADEPAAAIAEAARVLRPGGRIVVVDFAPHAEESLREDHAHRRLGFSDEEVADWFAAAGLKAEPPVRLAGNPLTVVLWPARRSGNPIHPAPEQAAPDPATPGRS